MKQNCAKGKIGEELALKFLKDKGFKILETNWRYSRLGEIDIIALDKEILTFIEVKTRSSVNFGYPIEAVNKTKIDKIRTIAGIYLNEKPDIKHKGVRFDCVGVILKDKPEITYYKDIYQF